MEVGACASVDLKTQLEVQPNHPGRRTVTSLMAELKPKKRRRSAVHFSTRGVQKHHKKTFVYVKNFLHFFWGNLFFLSFLGRFSAGGAQKHHKNIKKTSKISPKKTPSTSLF
jgi:hypothetical protein